MKPPKTKKGEGWLEAYKRALGDHAGVILNNSLVKLDLIEQIMLARNRDQHLENITSFDVRHSEDDMNSHPEFCFISESETEMLLVLAGDEPGDGEILNGSSPQQSAWIDINCSPPLM